MPFRNFSPHFDLDGNEISREDSCKILVKVEAGPLDEDASMRVQDNSKPPLPFSSRKRTREVRVKDEGDEEAEGVKETAGNDAGVPTEGPPASRQQGVDPTEADNRAVQVVEGAKKAVEDPRALAKPAKSTSKKILDSQARKGETSKTAVTKLGGSFSVVAQAVRHRQASRDAPTSSGPRLKGPGPTGLSGQHAVTASSRIRSDMQNGQGNGAEDFKTHTGNAAPPNLGGKENCSYYVDRQEPGQRDGSNNRFYQPYQYLDRREETPFSCGPGQEEGGDGYGQQQQHRQDHQHEKRERNMDMQSQAENEDEEIPDVQDSPNRADVDCRPPRYQHPLSIQDHRPSSESRRYEHHHHQPGGGHYVGAHGYGGRGSACNDFSYQDHNMQAEAWGHRGGLAGRGNIVEREGRFHQRDDTLMNSTPQTAWRVPHPPEHRGTLRPGYAGIQNHGMEGQSRVQAGYHTSGLLGIVDADGMNMDHDEENRADYECMMQTPYVNLESGSGNNVEAPSGPAWIPAADFLLNHVYEIWPFHEYPEPGRTDRTGRSTRRFRYEGDVNDLSSKDYPNLAKAAKHKLAAQYPYIPPADLLVVPPKKFGRSLFLDVRARDARVYSEIANADLSPFKLACSGAPYLMNQLLLRVNSLDIGNRRPQILYSMQRALASFGKIIAFWPMFRKDTIINNQPTQSDFTGTVYALLRSEGERVDTSRLPAFLSFADLPFPKRVPLIFDGRPEDCKQCSNRVPLHSAKDCPNGKCKCGGNHNANSCPRKKQRSRQPKRPRKANR